MNAVEWVKALCSLVQFIVVRRHRQIVSTVDCNIPFSYLVEIVHVVRQQNIYTDVHGDMHFSEEVTNTVRNQIYLWRNSNKITLTKLMNLNTAKVYARFLATGRRQWPVNTGRWRLNSDCGLRIQKKNG